MTSAQPKKILVRRYSGSARWNHWIVAISFIVLLLSGLAMFHPSLFVVGETLFGSGWMARWIHPWAGVALTVAFLGLFVRFLPANLPHFSDFTWFAGMKHVLAGHDEYLPELGKYNAGQKFVFWSQMVLTCTLFVTGVALWDANLPIFEQYTGIPSHHRANALGRRDPRHNGGANRAGLDHPRLRGVLGERHDPGHGPGNGHGRMGLAAPSPLAAPGGEEAGGGPGRRVVPGEAKAGRWCASGQVRSWRAAKS